MAFDASNRVASKDLGPSDRIAFHVRQFGNRRQRLRIQTQRRRQHLGRFGLELGPADAVEFRRGGDLKVIGQFLFLGELKQCHCAVL